MSVPGLPEGVDLGALLAELAELRRVVAAQAARIAELERLVGQQAFELTLLKKGCVRNAPSRSGGR